MKASATTPATSRASSAPPSNSPSRTKTSAPPSAPGSNPSLYDVLFIKRSTHALVQYTCRGLTHLTLNPQPNAVVARPQLHIEGTCPNESIPSMLPRSSVRSISFLSALIGPGYARPRPGSPNPATKRPATQPDQPQSSSQNPHRRSGHRRHASVRRRARR